MQSHGGILGQGLYWVADRLVQTVGVDILVVFLLVVGVVLLTGLSLAVVCARQAMAWSTPVACCVLEQAPSNARASQLETSAPSVRKPIAQVRGASLQPPEPAPEELIVRATHVEAPSVDGAAPAIGALEPWDVDVEDVMEPSESEGEHDPQAKEDEDGSFAAVDLRSTQESESDEEDEVPAEPIDESLLTPQGRLRDAVTDDPEFVWELPGAERILTRSTAEQARPDTAGQERTATSLVEALGHFGVQAKVIGTVRGAAHHTL